jgi:chromosome segregation ATPase
MPAVYDYSLEELQEKLRECTVAHGTVTKNFDEAKQNKEVQHQELADVSQKFENIEKKIDSKTKQCENLVEKINDQQTERQQIQQQVLPRLQKKSTQLNEDILKCQEKITELMKHQPKVK